MGGSCQLSIPPSSKGQPLAMPPPHPSSVAVGRAGHETLSLLSPLPIFRPSSFPAHKGWAFTLLCSTDWRVNCNPFRH